MDILSYQEFIQRYPTRHQSRSSGKHLVLCRGDKTQEQFAAELGVHVNTLARYERGERLPQLVILLKRRRLGVGLLWLFAGLSLPANNVEENTNRSNDVDNLV